MNATAQTMSGTRPFLFQREANLGDGETCFQYVLFHSAPPKTRFGRGERVDCIQRKKKTGMENENMPKKKEAVVWWRASSSPQLTAVGSYWDAPQNLEPGVAKSVVGSQLARERCSPASRKCV